ncbi:hypothetical protein ACHAXT_006422 [Thalassiosira profunda]
MASRASRFLLLLAAAAALPDNLHHPPTPSDGNDTDGGDRQRDDLQTRSGQCGAGESRCFIELITDRYPWETKWRLLGPDGRTITSGPPRGNYERETRYVGVECLAPGQYTLRMEDLGGDGICCNCGDGSFKVTLDGTTVVESDDANYYQKGYKFDVDPPVAQALLPLPPPPTPRPTRRQTRRPTPRPSRRPSPRPSRRPSPRPTPRPTPRPSRRPTPQGQVRCFTTSIYDQIDRDIQRLASSIPDIAERSHFLGGIVRLAAHDYMDFDRRDRVNPMGPDGCFDAAHPGNAGLPEDIWCDGCRLTTLYKRNYAEVSSRADFWIAAANAVIKHTSVDNVLDLRDTFRWGRKDARSCPGQGPRIPFPSSCDDVKEVFLDRMGLTWTDAAALMGAHTLGRGDRDFSGNDGTWARSDEESLVFDKEYFGEMFLQSWRPRANNFRSSSGGRVADDFTTGRPSGHPRVMLATDLCLVFDVDEDSECCTHGMLDGEDGCLNSSAASRRCPMLSRFHSRYEAREAVIEMLGGSYPNDNNAPFYDKFRTAWRKATTVGQEDLSPLLDSC